MSILIQIKEVIQNILGLIFNNDKCPSILIVNPFNFECLLLLAQKLVGYIGILGSCLYKVPVILKILDKRSCTGLSPISYYLETAAYSAEIYYSYLMNYPIHRYGNTIPSITQNLIVIFFFWSWGSDNKKLSILNKIKVLIMSYIYMYILYITPNSKCMGIDFIILYYIIILITSRVPQIIKNYQSKNIGVQSSITLGNAVIGSLGKMFTSFNGKIEGIFIGYSIAFILNIILIIQINMYKSNKYK